MSNSAKSIVTELLKEVDVIIDGDRPWDIKVHNPKLYKRVLAQGKLGAGESYMDGWWDADNLDEVVARVLSSGFTNKIKVSPALIRTVLGSVITNKQSVIRARRNASHHYNIGNDLYEKMLDKRMVYSCAYWRNAKNLDEAQEAKLDLICRKLHLEKGMTLLDIGCGWGGFVKFAAENYGVKATGISPAGEQIKVAKERTKGLPVKILQQDYRETNGSYDRVVSIGMLEHVGPKNYRDFFTRCKDMLNHDGIMLHHTIGSNRSVTYSNPWLNKYIFPGGVVPSLAQISKATERLLIIEDLQNLGPDYDKTLMAWHANFSKNLLEFQKKYGERFCRMWNFYLLSSAGGFRARNVQLWQIVMRKINASKTYAAVR